jgi:hypothetical protein
MACTILAQGPGYTIARDNEAHSSVPYGPADRDDGNRNHGFVDLVDRPDLAGSIPEAQRSAELVRLLQAVNKPGSTFLSLGCECGVFRQETESDDGYDRYVGSYIAIAFRLPELNTAERIHDLASYVLGRISGSRSHHIGFEITITPLRMFFGRTGCFEMHTNALGYGRTDEQAWDAFGFACSALAAAIDQVNNLPDDDTLFVQR